MIFLELFMTFFVIGLFTIGGGYAMLPLIQTQVVTVHQWIDEHTFTDIVAISQMTPGPIGINSATYIGYTVLEESGAIVLLMCRMYTKFKGNDIFDSVMGGLKPAVVGLIGAAAILLITPENFPDWKSWILFAAAFIVSWIWKANPIYVILAGGVLGLVLY